MSNRRLVLDPHQTQGASAVRVWLRRAVKSTARRLLRSMGDARFSGPPVSNAPLQQKSPADEATGLVRGNRGRSHARTATLFVAFHRSSASKATCRVHRQTSHVQRTACERSRHDRERQSDRRDLGSEAFVTISEAKPIVAIAKGRAIDDNVASAAISKEQRVAVVNPPAPFCRSDPSSHAG
jgi:hypothetical protein